jgi:ABC-type nickel/cobalt efflux system permease component RcnA
MKVEERQGLTAGIVFSVLMTIVNTGKAMAGQRTETFLKTLAACIIAVGAVGFLVHKLNKAPDPPIS